MYMTTVEDETEVDVGRAIKPDVTSIDLMGLDVVVTTAWSSTRILVNIPSSIQSMLVSYYQTAA